MLQHLSFRNNTFSGSIPPSISNLSVLQTLDWNYNLITGSIPLEIGQLRRLKILRIAYNKLSGAIPPTISNISSLELLSLPGNSLSEYGSEGIVSVKGDVYSYGIMLMEIFTRKKPTDEMFEDGSSLKSWVSESMPHAMIHVVDSTLLQLEGRQIDNIMAYASSILKLALNCCKTLPESRINMLDVVASLKKIRIRFMQNARAT
ncbi:hypothetical protein L6164_033513 [Bauhinia variegata]|uniref:Uncharacterized protein n=1 Tax=Bauhinia variegata TaxID=167791 RepID=A0ACB9KS36_BAUVA|nr:hypothetical protein L6164_033513 [Bauhinia variegata]